MTQAAPPTVLLTRPRDASEKLAGAIREKLGLNLVISPVLKIATTEVSIKLDSFSGVILTSPNAVHCMDQFDVPKGMICYAVGDRTAMVAREIGLDARSAAGDAEALLAMVLADPPSGKIIHLRGENARGNIAQRLSSAGIECDECIIYQQIAQDLTEEAKDLLVGEETVVVPLFSPRSAALVAGAASLAAGVKIIAMSDAVAEAVGDQYCAEITVASRPDETAMIDAIGQLPAVRVWVEAKGMQV